MGTPHEIHQSEESMNEVQSSRREFLIDATKKTIVVTALGMTIVGCQEEKKSPVARQEGKIPPSTILYQKTPAWDSYYRSC